MKTFKSRIATLLLSVLCIVSITASIDVSAALTQAGLTTHPRREFGYMQTDPNYVKPGVVNGSYTKTSGVAPMYSFAIVERTDGDLAKGFTSAPAVYSYDNVKAGILGLKTHSLAGNDFLYRSGNPYYQDSFCNQLFVPAIAGWNTYGLFNNYQGYLFEAGKQTLQCASGKTYGNLNYTNPSSSRTGANTSHVKTTIENFITYVQTPDGDGICPNPDKVKEHYNNTLIIDLDTVASSYVLHAAGYDDMGISWTSQVGSTGYTYEEVAQAICFVDYDIHMYAETYATYCKYQNVDKSSRYYDIEIYYYNALYDDALGDNTLYAMTPYNAMGAFTSDREEFTKLTAGGSWYNGSNANAFIDIYKNHMSSYAANPNFEVIDPNSKLSAKEALYYLITGGLGNNWPIVTDYRDTEKGISGTGYWNSSNLFFKCNNSKQAGQTFVLPTHIPMGGINQDFYISFDLQPKNGYVIKNQNGTTGTSKTANISYDLRYKLTDGTLNPRWTSVSTNEAFQAEVTTEIDKIQLEINACTGDDAATLGLKSILMEYKSKLEVLRGSNVASLFTAYGDNYEGCKQTLLETYIDRKYLYVNKFVYTVASDDSTAKVNEIEGTAYIQANNPRGMHNYYERIMNAKGGLFTVTFTAEEISNINLTDYGWELTDILSKKKHNEYQISNHSITLVYDLNDEADKKEAVDIITGKSKVYIHGYTNFANENKAAVFGVNLKATMQLGSETTYNLDSVKNYATWYSLSSDPNANNAITPAISNATGNGMVGYNETGSKISTESDTYNPANRGGYDWYVSSGATRDLDVYAKIVDANVYDEDWDTLAGIPSSEEVSVVFGATSAIYDIYGNFQEQSNIRRRIYVTTDVTGITRLGTTEFDMAWANKDTFFDATGEASAESDIASCFYNLDNDFWGPSGDYPLTDDKFDPFYQKIDNWPTDVKVKTNKKPETTDKLVIYLQDASVDGISSYQNGEGKYYRADGFNYSSGAAAGDCIFKVTRTYTFKYTLEGFSTDHCTEDTAIESLSDTKAKGTVTIPAFNKSTVDVTLELKKKQNKVTYHDCDGSDVKGTCTHNFNDSCGGTWGCTCGVPSGVPHASGCKQGQAKCSHKSNNHDHWYYASSADEASGEFTVVIYGYLMETSSGFEWKTAIGLGDCSIPDGFASVTYEKAAIEGFDTAETKLINTDKALATSGKFKTLTLDSDSAIICETANFSKINTVTKLYGGYAYDSTTTAIVGGDFARYSGSTLNRKAWFQPWTDGTNMELWSPRGNVSSTMTLDDWVHTEQGSKDNYSCKWQDGKYICLVCNPGQPTKSVPITMRKTYTIEITLDRISYLDIRKYANYVPYSATINSNSDLLESSLRNVNWNVSHAEGAMVYNLDKPEYNNTLATNPKYTITSSTARENGNRSVKDVGGFNSYFAVGELGDYQLSKWTGFWLSLDNRQDLGSIKDGSGNPVSGAYYSGNGRILWANLEIPTIFNGMPNVTLADKYLVGDWQYTEYKGVNTTYQPQSKLNAIANQMYQYNATSGASKKSGFTSPNTVWSTDYKENFDFEEPVTVNKDVWFVGYGSHSNAQIHSDELGDVLIHVISEFEAGQPWVYPAYKNAKAVVDYIISPSYKNNIVVVSDFMDTRNESHADKDNTVVGYLGAYRIQYSLDTSRGLTQPGIYGTCPVYTIDWKVRPADQTGNDVMPYYTDYTIPENTFYINATNTGVNGSGYRRLDNSDMMNGLGERGYNLATVGDIISRQSSDILVYLPIGDVYKADRNKMQEELRIQNYLVNKYYGFGTNSTVGHEGLIIGYAGKPYINALDMSNTPATTNWHIQGGYGGSIGQFLTGEVPAARYWFDVDTGVHPGSYDLSDISGTKSELYDKKYSSGWNQTYYYGVGTENVIALNYFTAETEYLSAIKTKLGSTPMGNGITLEDFHKYGNYEDFQGGYQFPIYASGDNLFKDYYGMGLSIYRTLINGTQPNLKWGRYYFGNLKIPTAGTFATNHLVNIYNTNATSPHTIIGSGYTSSSATAALFSNALGSYSYTDPIYLGSSISGYFNTWNDKNLVLDKYAEIYKPFVNLNKTANDKINVKWSLQGYSNTNTTAYIIAPSGKAMTVHDAIHLPSVLESGSPLKFYSTSVLYIESEGVFADIGALNLNKSLTNGLKRNSLNAYVSYVLLNANNDGSTGAFPMNRDKNGVGIPNLISYATNSGSTLDKNVNSTIVVSSKYLQTSSDTKINPVLIHNPVSTEYCWVFDASTVNDNVVDQRVDAASYVNRQWIQIGGKVGVWWSDFGNFYDEDYQRTTDPNMHLGFGKINPMGYGFEYTDSKNLDDIPFSSLFRDTDVVNSNGFAIVPGYNVGKGNVFSTNGVNTYVDYTQGFWVSRSSEGYFYMYKFNITTRSMESIKVTPYDAADSEFYRSVVGSNINAFGRSNYDLPDDLSLISRTTDYGLVVKGGHPLQEFTGAKYYLDNIACNAGYMDYMDCSPWTQHRYISFPCPVGWYTSTGEWKVAPKDTLIDVNEIINVTCDTTGDWNPWGAPKLYQDTEMFDKEPDALLKYDSTGAAYCDMQPGYYLEFYVLTSAEEVKGGSIQFISVANNAPADDAQLMAEINRQDRPNNMLREGSDYAALHVAKNSFPVDVVGRIGNVCIEDYGDFRFSNLFKMATDEWLIPGVIHRVDIERPNETISVARDIFSNDVTSSFAHHATLSMTSFADGVDASGNPILKGKAGTFKTLPLTPSDNNVQDYKYTIPRLGYDIYMDIETIGNYYGINSNHTDVDTNKEFVMEIIPYWYLLDLDSGEYIPVDFYYGEEGSRTLCYEFGKIDNTYAQSKFQLEVDLPTEYKRRDISSAEYNLNRTDLTNPLYDSLGANVHSIETGPDYIGTTSRIILDEYDRTFIGSNVMYGYLDGGPYDSTFNNIHIINIGNNPNINLGYTHTNPHNIDNNNILSIINIWLSGTQFNQVGQYGNDPASYTYANRLAQQAFHEQSQRWYFNVGLPSSVIAVPNNGAGSIAQRDITRQNEQMNIDHPSNTFICLLSIRVKGEVWELQYDAEASGMLVGDKWPFTIFEDADGKYDYEWDASTPTGKKRIPIIVCGGNPGTVTIREPGPGSSTHTYDGGGGNSGEDLDVYGTH